MFADTLPEAKTRPANPKMQTFVFSATMSKTLQENLKRRRTARPSRRAAGSTLGPSMFPTCAEPTLTPQTISSRNLISVTPSLQ